MAVISGTTEVGGNAVPLCPAGEAGVRVTNRGEIPVFLGGPDVSTEGYPLEPGATETFYGRKPKETAVVPEPPGDLAADILYARAGGAGTARVAWIGIA